MPRDFNRFPQSNAICGAYAKQDIASKTFTCGHLTSVLFTSSDCSASVQSISEFAHLKILKKKPAGWFQFTLQKSVIINIIISS